MLRVLVLLELNIPTVNVYPAKSKVPAVNVEVVLASVVTAPANVVVPLGQLIVNKEIVLPFVVIVPVPTVVTDSEVNVPPLDNVILLIFNVVVASVKAVVPKLRLLNQLPVVSVCIAVPLPVKDKFKLLVDEPPVVPNVYVLVTSAAAVNPPVPVQVKLVAFAIDILVAAAVVVDNIILLDPKLILRVFELFELKVPIVKSYPPKFNVPAVNIPDDVAVYVCVLSNVKVPPSKLKPIPPSCLLN